MSEKKKTVLITGCSSGIGQDAAHFLVEKGWIVFAGVRKEEDAAKLRGQNVNLRPVILDVTKEDQIRRTLEEIRVAVGDDGLDGLVNNAGMGVMGPFEFTPISDVRRQFDVNFFGIIQLTQEAMPLLRMGRPGRVVNVGSLVTDQNLPFLSFYCASKSAILSISESFRREVAKWGIKVVSIKPGPVKTDLEKNSMREYEEFKEKFPEGTPCRELYGKMMENIPKVSEQFEKNKVSPRYVSKRILTALTASNPRNIYCDTWGTYFMSKLIGWLPVSWYDAMVSKLFATQAD